jgi:hypothetical protein
MRVVPRVYFSSLSEDEEFFVVGNTKQITKVTRVSYKCVKKMTGGY